MRRMMQVGGSEDCSLMILNVAMDISVAAIMCAGFDRCYDGMRWISPSLGGCALDFFLCFDNRRFNNRRFDGVRWIRPLLR